jgi:hypothetical protein
VTVLNRLLRQRFGRAESSIEFHLLSIHHCGNEVIEAVAVRGIGSQGL